MTALATFFLLLIGPSHFTSPLEGEVGKRSAPGGGFASPLEGEVGTRSAPGGGFASPLEREVGKRSAPGGGFASPLEGEVGKRSAPGGGFTSPREFFGFEIGDDYRLANYRQLAEYWRKLDSESDRVTVVSIGRTEEGREQLMAIVSSPENLRRADHFRSIVRKLALGEPQSAGEAGKLADQGKAVVWIDGGLHATEVLGAQQLIETTWRLVSGEDAETQRIRRDVITLLVHANPDGMDLVSDWYMRRSKPEERSIGGVPRLYQKYIGHDNNRDFYASNMAETTNMNRVLYREWFPQILYNHHQSAPAGTIIFAPPFRGPFNYHVDPLVEVQTAMVGMAMHTRFASEGKPGAVMRNAASYQTWWNGGLRTTAYFHNIVGILTETFGSPNPNRVAYLPNKLVPSTDIPFPVEPQEWNFRRSIEYEVTANYAILDYASRHRESLLINAWKMARNAIEKGRKDTWTFYPSRIESNGRGAFSALKAPDLRDAKAYVIPSDQADFPTAIKFANMLVKVGVAVHQATADFSVSGKTYPRGSLVVRCDQAFRAHVLDMFEPQDYPNDFQYPGGPPIAPYDSAGYTPAFTMGVQFDRILEPLASSARLESVDGFAKPSDGVVRGSVGAGSALELNAKISDSYGVVARLLASGVPVWRMAGGDPSGAPSVDLGSFLVPASHARQAQEAARPLGVDLTVRPRVPAAGVVQLRQPRIALLDRYGGSMPSGWTRWILEQFGFPFEVVFPPDIDRGGLRDKFEVLILVDGMTFGGPRGAILSSLWGAPDPHPLTPSPYPAEPGQGEGGGAEEQGGSLQDDPTIPAEWRARMGSLTAERSLPKVREFLEAGGTVIAIGSATNIGAQMGLPIGNALSEVVDGRDRPLPREKFYCPGSVLRMRVDTSHPAAWGLSEHVDTMFDTSPAFKLLPGWEQAGIEKIAWFDSDKPLRSGWCWGQGYLKDTIAALSAPVGKGRLNLFGPEVLFRGQTHAGFKLVFNAILRP